MVNEGIHIYRSLVSTQAAQHAAQMFHVNRAVAARLEYHWSILDDMHESCRSMVLASSTMELFLTFITIMESFYLMSSRYSKF